MSRLLEVRDLQVRYPLPRTPGSLLGRNRATFVEIVPGVSFEIARGETLAVVGESGSGKTTLAMALCGLVPVAGGEVHFEGRPVERSNSGLLATDRRQVAVMFQDPVGSLSPRMTVRRLLAEPYRIHPGHCEDPLRSALDLLDMVGLTREIADRYPHQLSGGQARRVGVARALALRPRLLIADEPTAGLDVSVQGEILNLLSDLQKDMGLGMLVITHNLNIVRHVADHMAIMYLGRFVEQGRSGIIFRTPRHPYTGALLASNPGTNPDAAQHRIKLEGEAPSPLQRPAGCEFHLRCPRSRPDCLETFPPAEGSKDQQEWHCRHPLD